MGLVRVLSLLEPERDNSAIQSSEDLKLLSYVKGDMQRRSETIKFAYIRLRLVPLRDSTRLNQALGKTSRAAQPDFQINSAFYLSN